MANQDPLYHDRWWLSARELASANEVGHANQTNATRLRLHYRDYPGRSPGDASPTRPALVCLHGLTRNARDFADFAAHAASPAGGGWRVLVPELRGRGLSPHADSASYTLGQYVHDVLALLDAAGLAKVAIIGTSLGGLIAMRLAVLAPARIAGVLLNDIGPVIEPAGLVRIARYVGGGERFATWEEAAAHQRAMFAASFPTRGDADWLASAKRVMIATKDGIVHDYDPAIAEPLRPLREIAAPPAATSPAPTSSAPTPPAPESPLDPWAGLAALADMPVLLLRGALSDLLTEASFAEMARRLPMAEAVTVPDVGHPPELDEPTAAAAITRWLARLAVEPAG